MQGRCAMPHCTGLCWAEVRKGAESSRVEPHVCVCLWVYGWEKKTWRGVLCCAVLWCAIQIQAAEARVHLLQTRTQKKKKKKKTQKGTKLGDAYSTPGHCAIQEFVSCRLCLPLNLLQLCKLPDWSPGALGRSIERERETGGWSCTLFRNAVIPVSPRWQLFPHFHSC